MGTEVFTALEDHGSYHQKAVKHVCTGVYCQRIPIQVIEEVNELCRRLKGMTVSRVFTHEEIRCLFLTLRLKLFSEEGHKLTFSA